MTRERRPAAAYALVAAAILGVVALVAWLEPILGDSYFGVAWRTGDRTLWGQVLWNYRVYNPRLGENALYLTSAYPLVHVLVTPVVVLLALVGLEALATGRLPRPREPREAGTLLVATALLCATWNIGSLLFYRPYLTNYVYAFVVQVWLLVPLRVARGDGGAWRWLAAPAMLLLGVAAGLCNEHTGPTLIVAVAGLAAWLVRRRPRAWPWAAAALVGVVVGFVLLVTAPAQVARHGGKGHESIVARVLSREPGEVVVQLVGGAALEAAGALVALVGAWLVVRWRRRRGVTVAWPRATIAALLVAAVSIVGTLLASPTWAERLYFAPAMLVAGAALCGLRAACAAPAAWRALVGVAAVVCLVHAAGFVRAQWRQHEDYAARAALVAAAPPDAALFVPPARELDTSHWIFGDELRKPGWRTWRAQTSGRSLIALDTDAPRVLAASGVPLCWTVDGVARPGCHELPSLRRFDAGEIAAARAASTAMLAPAETRGEACLRLYLPPGMTGGRVACLERWRDGREAPAADGAGVVATPLGLSLACDGPSCLVIPRSGSR